LGNFTAILTPAEVKKYDFLSVKLLE
jgi:hypothetical protein